jgi:prophage tail gpP-like protein
MTDPERYRLTLHLDGRRVLDGWWDSEKTARRKFTATVGDYGRDGAEVALVDTASGETIASWPTPVVGGAP